MYRSLEDTLNLSEDEKYKQYIDNLKSEIQSRPNKEELDKKILLSNEGSVFIHSHRTMDEHEKLIQELGEDGIWFYPVVSLPKNCTT